MNEGLLGGVGVVQSEADLELFVRQTLDQIGFPNLQAAVDARTSGADSLSWAASQASSVRTIQHGLNVSPSKVLLCAQMDGSGRSDPPSLGYQNVTTSSFDVVGWMPSGVFTGSLGLSWQAEA